MERHGLCQHIVSASQTATQSAPGVQRMRCRAGRPRQSCRSGEEASSIVRLHPGQISLARLSGPHH